jgi:hypothetical protein
MHLRQGKKVSILVPGDVDSGPVASRQVETWECLVATSTRREYVFVTYAALSTQR